MTDLPVDGPRDEEASGASACRHRTISVLPRRGLPIPMSGRSTIRTPYAGRPRTGEPAGIAPVVDRGLFSRVQTARERRRTRMPGGSSSAATRSAYGVAAATATCTATWVGIATRPRRATRFRPHDPGPRQVDRSSTTAVSMAGDDRDGYEDAVGSLLTQIGRIDDWAISEVLRLHADYRPRADDLTFGLDRSIARRRRSSIGEDPDLVACTADHGATRCRGGLSTGCRSMVAALVRPRSLPTCGRSPDGPIGPRGVRQSCRRSSPRSMFLGLRAHGVRAQRRHDRAWPRFRAPTHHELKGKVAEFGRSERACASHTDISVESIRLAPVASPAEGVAS